MRRFYPAPAALLGLAALAAGAHAQAPATDLAMVMPGVFEVALFSNFAEFEADFPGVTREGWIGERLDAFAAEGYPDPRGAAGQVGVGLDLKFRSYVPREILYMGTGPLNVVPKIRAKAEAEGIRVKETAYRGVTFWQPLSRIMPVMAAELPGGISHLHFDRRLPLWPRRRFRNSRRAVDIMRGQDISFGVRHGLSLTPGTYLVGALQAGVGREKAPEEDTPETRAFGFHALAHATGAWRKDGGRIRLGAEVGCRKVEWAQKLEAKINGKLAKWKAGTSLPVLKAMLDAVDVRRVGSAVMVALDFDLAASQRGMRALNRLGVPRS